MELRNRSERPAVQTPQPLAHPALPCRESYSRQRTSCSEPSARPTPTGCGKGGAACGSTCGGTTRTPSHMTAADRPQRPQHPYLQPEHGPLSPAQPRRHGALQPGLMPGDGRVKKQPTQELLVRVTQATAWEQTAPHPGPRVLVQSVDFAQGVTLAKLSSSLGPWAPCVQSMFKGNDPNGFSQL